MPSPSSAPETQLVFLASPALATAHATQIALAALLTGVALLGSVGCAHRITGHAPSQEGAKVAFGHGPPREVDAGQSHAIVSTFSGIDRCEGVITESGGCTSPEIGARAISSWEVPEACHGERGGKIRILIREQEGNLALDVERGATLDPTERACVLDALATIDLDEGSSPSSNVTLRPHGFTSAVTLDW